MCNYEAVGNQQLNLSTRMERKKKDVRKVDVLVVVVVVVGEVGCSAASSNKYIFEMPSQPQNSAPTSHQLTRFYAYIFIPRYLSLTFPLLFFDITSCLRILFTT